MAAAVIVLYWASAWLGGLSAVRRRVLIIGGGLVAGSQLVPVIQIIAGFVAAAITDRLTGSTLLPINDDLPILTESSGFLATMITGVALILASAVVGTAACWLSGKLKTPAEPGESTARA
jgi:hypothetical protein